MYLVPAIFLNESLHLMASRLLSPLSILGVHSVVLSYQTTFFGAGIFAAFLNFLISASVTLLSQPQLAKRFTYANLYYEQWNVSEKLVFDVKETESQPRIRKFLLSIKQFFPQVFAYWSDFACYLIKFVFVTIFVASQFTLCYQIHNRLRLIIAYRGTLN